MSLLDNKVFYRTLVGLIFGLSILFRLFAFDQVGGDHRTFKTAVTSYIEGVNPYEYTVLSYQQDDLKHGYAYMPTLLYIQTFFVRINMFFNLDQPTKYLWKIPVLLADIGVGILLYKILQREKASRLSLLIGLLFWFFNPYFFMRYEYTNYEPLSVFSLLLGLTYLGKKDFLAGVFFALAVTLKTFPVILFAVFLLNVKKIPKFLLAGLLTGIIISLPFFRSFHDLTLLFQGAFLVHGERGIQGRPLFSFLTYNLQSLGISFYQAEFSKIYSLIALLGAQLVPLYLYYKKKIKNVWILSLFSFSVYYLFTPVLNRTHLLWGIPVIYLGSLISHSKSRTKHYATVLVVFVAMSCYYYFWTKGFKNPVAFGGKIWIDPVFDNRTSFPFVLEVCSRVNALRNVFSGN
jgi:hypothetical protein